MGIRYPIHNPLRLHSGRSARPKIVQSPINHQEDVLTDNNPKVTRRRRGRPPRATRSQRALRGVDVTKVSLRLVLQTIAADVSQPGSTRVSACRLLHEIEQMEAAVIEALRARDAEKPKDGDRDDVDTTDADITREALAALRERAN